MTTASVRLLEEAVADPGFVLDPYPTYQRLRHEMPIWRTPTGSLVVSRYEHCATILRDFRTYGQTPKPHPSFVSKDPPEHTRLRKLVSHAFTPLAIGRIHARIEAVCADLVARVRDRGTMELVEDLAKPLPVAMITEMLGVPAGDGDRWEVWANAIHQATAAPRYLPTQVGVADDVLARAEAASREEAEYFRELIAARRDRAGNDVISVLLRAREGDDALSEDEILWTLVLLLGAGHHTSVNLISNGTLALLGRPEQFELLRRAPARWLAPAIDEMLRFDSVLQEVPRVARVDTELGGIPIAAGTEVRVVLGSANRDEAVFPEPDTFDITRDNADQHLAFGLGAHHCIGFNLARAEAEVALRSLVDLPGLHLDGDDHPHDGLYALRGLARLRLAWSNG